VNLSDKVDGAMGQKRSVPIIQDAYRIYSCIRYVPRTMEGIRSFIVSKLISLFRVTRYGRI